LLDALASLLDLREDVLAALLQRLELGSLLLRCLLELLNLLLSALDVGGDLGALAADVLELLRRDLDLVLLGFDLLSPGRE
jgi:hypothetical protein